MRVPPIGEPVKVRLLLKIFYTTLIVVVPLFSIKVGPIDPAGPVPHLIAGVFVLIHILKLRGLSYNTIPISVGVVGILNGWSLGLDVVILIVKVGIGGTLLFVGQTLIFELVLFIGYYFTYFSILWIEAVVL